MSHSSIALPTSPQRGAPLARAARGTVRAVAASKEGVIGLVLTVVSLLIAAIGPLLAPQSPTALVATSGQTPSAAHLLGTDYLGRDVLSRLLSGGQEILAVAFVATAIAFAFGATLGIALALYRGAIDTGVSRVIDVVISLPPLLVVLVILAGFGTGRVVVVIALFFVFSPRIARVIRGAALSAATQEYVLAAIARGEGPANLIVREIAPNITPQLLVEFALRFTYAILFIAALSFLGLGAQPPSPDWGLMAAENRLILTVNPLATVAPAIMICLLSVGVSLLADGITHYFGINMSPVRG